MDESISVIPDSAFMKCPNLTAALLPAVEELGRFTFSDCDRLSWVAMPNALAIGDSAFYGSSALHSLFMPVLQTTGESAFDGTECGATGADCMIAPAAASPAPSTSALDCTACIQGFIEAGGCNAMISGGDADAYIPADCDACGESDAIGQRVEQICSALVSSGDALANASSGSVPMLGGDWTGEFGSPTTVQCDTSGACAASCCTCDGAEVADCLTCPDGAPPVDADGDGAGECIPAVSSPAPSAGGLSDQESANDQIIDSIGGSVGEASSGEAGSGATVTPVSDGTVSSGATVTPSDGVVSSGATVTPSDATRSASSQQADAAASIASQASASQASASQASGAAAATTQDWSNPPDCSTCVVQFGKAGGCNVWEQGGNATSLVPAGCSHCEQTAYVYCFNVSTVLSCEQCVQQLDQAGGCSQWTNTGIFPNATFPSGCGHCGNEAYRYCFNATSGYVPADSVAPSYRMLHFGERQRKAKYHSVFL